MQCADKHACAINAQQGNNMIKMPTELVHSHDAMSFPWNINWLIVLLKTNPNVDIYSPFCEYMLFCGLTHLQHNQVCVQIEGQLGVVLLIRPT